jgi:hypothetical protein
VPFFISSSTRFGYSSFPDGESPLRFYAGVIYDIDGIRLIRDSALYPLYQRFQRLPHFPEVKKSWRAACALQHFGLPIGKRETTLEEEFFYHLRAGHAALSLYPRLVINHLKRNDREFLKRYASAQKRPRGRPKAKGSLACRLLQSWLHVGLWLMTNDDRVKFIEHGLGFRIRSTSGLPDEWVMKAVQRLALLSWWDFPATYLEAPVKVTLYRNNELQFLFPDRWPGLDSEWT